MFQSRPASILAFSETDGRTRHERGFFEKHPVVVQGHDVHEGGRRFGLGGLEGVGGEVIGAIIEEGHGVFVVRATAGFVRDGIFVEFGEHPVGDLVSRGRGGVAIVLEDEAGFVSGAVDDEFGAHSGGHGRFFSLVVTGRRWIRLKEYGGSIIVVHQRTRRRININRSGFRNVTGPQDSIPGLPPLVVLGTQTPPQPIPIDPTIRPVQPHPLLHGNVERSAEIAIGLGPRPIDALVVVEGVPEGGEEGADGVPFVLPDAVVGDPAPVVVGVGEEDVERGGGGGVGGVGGGEEGGDGAGGGSASQDEDVAFVFGGWRGNW